MSSSVSAFIFTLHPGMLMLAAAFGAILGVLFIAVQTLWGEPRPKKTMLFFALLVALGATLLIHTVGSIMGDVAPLEIEVIAL